MKLSPFFSVVSLDQVDSTNEEARRRAVAGASEGTLIVARSQSAGRGRRARRWESPAGNLYMSLLLRPSGTIDKAARFSFVAAVALSDAIAGLAPQVNVAHKWPNDLLICGRKCAGMLLESAAGGRDQLDWLVIGIGVNLSRHPANLPFPATDLAGEGAAGMTPDSVMEAFAKRFLHWRDVWRNGGFAPVRRAWLARAFCLGKPFEVHTGGETLGGVFSGLAEDGALLLDRDGVVRRVSAGDVFPADA